jgi:hypothetical protein
LFPVVLCFFSNCLIFSIVLFSPFQIRSFSPLSFQFTRYNVSCTALQHISSPFHKKFVTIVLTFSLKIILRQFLSPFHKDYLTTNLNLTTKITLTIKHSSLGVLDTTLYDKVCQWFATDQWFSPSTPVFATNKTDRYIVERGR